MQYQQVKRLETVIGNIQEWIKLAEATVLKQNATSADIDVALSRLVRAESIEAQLEINGPGQPLYEQIQSTRHRLLTQQHVMNRSQHKYNSMHFGQVEAAEVQAISNLIRECIYFNNTDVRTIQEDHESKLHDNLACRVVLMALENLRVEANHVEIELLKVREWGAACHYGNIKNRLFSLIDAAEEKS